MTKKLKIHTIEYIPDCPKTDNCTITYCLGCDYHIGWFGATNQVTCNYDNRNDTTNIDEVCHICGKPIGVSYYVRHGVAMHLAHLNCYVGIFITSIKNEKNEEKKEEK